MILDAKVEAGALSFFKLESFFKKIGQRDSVISLVQGYIMLNAQMNPIDTVVSPTPHELYWHDFRINSKGERLISIKQAVPLDLSKLTGNVSDTNVLCDIDVIQILDDNNKLIYAWRATDKLDPSVFQLKESVATKPFAKKKKNADVINWSHLTGTVWDYDDNFLYSFRFVGIGKVSRKDGSVLWHLDFKDLPQVINGDTMRCYFQHDLNLLYHNDTSAFYSLYSLGSISYPISHGVVFELDKRTNKIVSFKNYFPKSLHRTDGQGSFDIDKNGDYVFSYGIYDHSKTASRFIDEIEYGSVRGVTGILQIEIGNICYKVHKLKNREAPPRPQIILLGDSLVAIGDMSDWRWYEVEGGTPKSINFCGSSISFLPKPGHTYIVEGKFGVGYAVSYPFDVSSSRPIIFYVVMALITVLILVSFYKKV